MSINDFDSNEWDRINEFFNKRDAFNKTIKEVANLFPKNIEYRTKSIQEELASLAMKQAKLLEEYHKKHQTTPTKNSDPEDGALKIVNKYNNVADRFKSLYISLDTPFKFQYDPAGIYLFFEKELDNTDLSLSTSSIGHKLKGILKSKY